MKRTRKQPRRMTPPLCLRDDEGGREIVALDEELITSRRQQSGRVTVFLNLGPGLQLKIGSRCVNKRRFTSVTISRADVPYPAPAPANGFQEAREVMQPADEREPAWYYNSFTA